MNKTDLPKVSSERTLSLSSQVVRIIEVIDSVWILAIGRVVDNRVQVNGSTCSLRQFSTRFYVERYAYHSSTVRRGVHLS
jgi:hypothetical protein